MSDFSDQTMTLAATAVFAKGDTTIHGDGTYPQAGIQSYAGNR